VRLVKGSHIVTRRLFDHDHAYIFQNPDKRIIFAIPYEREFTLIGTTDIEYHGDPSDVAITEDESRYLCESINRYFKRKITLAAVCWTYSGVRPLLEEEGADNPSAVTRDYRLELDAQPGEAPLLSVFGGKITTFRKLAEEAADRLAPLLLRSIAADARAGSSAGDAARGKVDAAQAPIGPAWTASATLPGGDLRTWLGAGAPPAHDVVATFEKFVAALAARHPSLPASLVERLARAYGTRSDVLLKNGLGREVAPQLFEAELDYLRRVEWARRGDDVLWRRSKLGLHLDEAGRNAVDRWMDGVSR